MNQDNERSCCQNNCKCGKGRLLLVFGFFIISVLAGFLLGKSTNICGQPVLGVVSKNNNYNGQVALLKPNYEETSQDMQGLQFQPSGIRIVIATPEPVSTPNPGASPEDEKLYWGGPHRGGNDQSAASATPSPLPDKMEHGKQRATPQPTPKYWANFDRNNNDTDNFLDLEALRVRQIITERNINLENMQMTKTENNQVLVTGLINESLFGIFPIRFNAEVTVDFDSGEATAIKLPWWRALIGGKSWMQNVTQIKCGDGVCASTENPVICPVDCTGAVCGNNVCEYGEGINNCSPDCLNVGIPQTTSQ